MNYKKRIALNSRLDYIHIPNGNIGLISNSAGGCMATMDLISLHGGAAANFCDLGGQTHHEKITDSLILLEKDTDVKVILINVFSTMRTTEKIAYVVREAHKLQYVSKPMIVRIKGENSDHAKFILSNIPNVSFVEDFD